MSSTIAIDRASGERRGRDQHREHPVLHLIVELVTLRCRRRLVWIAQLHDTTGVSIDDPEREYLFYAKHEQLAATNARVSELEDRLAKTEDPFSEFARLFRLDSNEFDLLLACVAVELEPAIGALYAQLNGHPERRYVTQACAARLFGHGHRQLWNPSGSLAIWGFIHALNVGPGHAVPLIVDPQVVARIRGQLGLDLELVGCTEIIPVQRPLEGWPLADLHERTRRSVNAELPLRLVLVGPQGCGRRSLAASLAQRFGASAIAIDTDDITDEHWPETYVRVVRFAAMAGLIPVWHGQRCGRRWPRSVPPGPLQFVICEDARSVSDLPGVVDQVVVMPTPALDERLGLWHRLVPSSVAWGEGAVEHLAARHRLSVGDIAQIGQRLPVGADEAALMAREQTRGRLGDLGRLMDCPFDWSDLILASGLRNSLEDFTFEAAERVRFWETPGAKRLFPRGTGLVGLLAGPPGTGKTMAAQVIAAELELDLFRINLATVISKYIGETAKNLDRIFARAARMNAVLLFDEADALFSKRTEVKDSHDRHANTDTNYLLQLVEEYQGIALLASNKKNNIDPAFVRRIRYIFDFRKPDAAQRRTIWRRVLRELVGADILREVEPAVAVLCEAVEISGAQIKNAVLAAVFISRRRRRTLGIEDLMDGIDRELGKEGRGLHDRERERLRRNA
ncbi:AAA family ATPase [Enhygromyxa salina]|uniref:ATP-dependent zinc metalloprotease FtsH 1 n=1 Tax=Enhygromyxa salina TaxID=215803 RepID=A0A2S9XIJ8_9BACT|nr:AAA family ATPase [Enhygromyxa salina]PRP92672.1 ATP-dependent zinc metalloprotease FtsH 1 [Enhygromyxa salina]